MNFRRRRAEEPEINLIAFIDVLLVVLIFLIQRNKTPHRKR
jgi:biopolymer transport protein ExbD